MPKLGPGPGSICGEFELLLPIASGGMGTVWAARPRGHRSATRLVAVKTMLPALAADPRFERMFRAEAEIASRIGHANVCKILGMGIGEAGELYLAMEWIEGSSSETLLQACRKRGAPMPAGVAACIGAQAAWGLHAAHELRDEGGQLMGLVHRDVSPHNIIVSSTGIAKIIDFGVAKAVALLENPTTATGQIKGKARYLSPEQVAGEDLDRRADVFALGIVLYVLTTGIHPFESGHELLTMRCIHSGRPPAPPCDLVPSYPADLSAVIMKALSRDRSERYSSMIELASALEAIVVKLGMGRAHVAAFTHQTVSARIAMRARKITQAARIRDARALVPPLATAPAQGRPAGPAAKRTWGRQAVIAAALCALGAVLGAGALQWLTARSQPAPPSAEGLTTALQPLIARAASIQVNPRDRAVPPVPSPAASPAGVPSKVPEAAPPRDNGRAKFRESGF